MEGQLGFDWVTFQNDRFGVNVDLDLTVFLRPTVPPSNDTVQNRYDRVEGLSGSPLGDILAGTPNINGANIGNELTEDNMLLIEGLGDLVPLSVRRELGLDVVTGEPLGRGWTNGEIIIGGAGSDLMIGEGGDDIIDGDVALKVAILTPDPAIRSGPLGQALLAAKTVANSTASQADLDAAAVLAATELQAAAAAVTTAANAAVLAAEDVVLKAEAAQTGLSALTVTDAIGNLIQAAVLGGDAADAQSIRDAWQAFLDSCTAALGDLGFDVGATPAKTQLAAIAAQAAAVEAEATVTTLALTEAADASVLLVAPAATALAQAQADLDAVDTFILVPGMRDIMDAVFGGFINPGELSISRIISDEDPTDAATDSAKFSGNLLDYTIVDLVDGFTEITDNRDLPLNIVTLTGQAGNDGRDLVRNVERLVFSDQVLVIGGGLGANSVAEGIPTISGTPEVGLTLTASIAGVTDADNITLDNPTGAVIGAVDWTWESELVTDSGFFTPIRRIGGLNGNGDLFAVRGESIVLTAAESGRLVRVVGTFQDEALVFEVVTSVPVLVAGDLLGDATLTIGSANWQAVQERLTVDGIVSPISSIVTLFEGTADAGGTFCTGVFIANVSVDALGVFSYNSGSGAFPVDPLDICVQSDSGTGVVIDDIAESVPTN